MVNSRSLDDLNPIVRKLALRFVDCCKTKGIDILVTSTYRDNESQALLYAQGRTVPGKKVTNAKAGQSWHNWRAAFDIVPLRNGKPVWNTTGDDLKLWQQVGAIGVACGLEWAGNWERFKEFPHFQYTAGLTLDDMQASGQLT